jgi:hypothetical protein
MIDDPFAWLPLLTQPDQVVELRALQVGTARAVSRVFRADEEGLAALAEQARAWDEAGARGVYFTVNPIRADLADGSAAKDADIVCRRWLLLDIDAVRPADTSTTAAERAAAWAVCDRVRRAVVAMDWPEPVLADSGNGFHLLLPIEARNDEASKAMCKAFLAELSSRLSTASAKIDASVFNAARIVRCYGTTTRKGVATAERPHRRSRYIGRRHFGADVPEQATPEEHRRGWKALQAMLSQWRAAEAMAGGHATSSTAAYAESALKAECRKVREATPGNRNNTLNSAAFALGQLVAGGSLDHGRAVSALTQAAKSCGLGDAEIETTLASAFAAGGKEPRTVPPAKTGKTQPATSGQEQQTAEKDSKAPATSGKTPSVKLVPPYKKFPVHLLPTGVRELVEKGAEAIGCDPALIALPALVTVASCIGNAYSVQLKRNWFEPAILWAATVAESGQKKSPGFELAVQPLNDIQSDEFERAKGEKAEYEKEMKAARDKKEALPEMPKTAARYVTSDATVEAIAELLEGQPKGLLLAVDELDAWLQSFVRYKGRAGGSDRPQWLTLNRAGTLTIDRKTGDRRTLSIRRAAVSVIGTIQPPILVRSFDSESLASGFAARLLLAMPPRQKRRWTEQEVPLATETKYKSLLASLLALGLKDQEKRQPHALKLTPEAKELWVSFYDEWSDRQHRAEGAGAAALAKLEAYAARFALVHHVVENVGPLGKGKQEGFPIGKRSIQAGIDLAKWFSNEADRIYRLVNETEDAREGRRLLEWIEQQGEPVTARGVHKANKSRYPSSEAAELALNDLVKSGWGKWEQRPTGEKGGRPTAVFILLTPKPRNPETGDDDDDEPEDDAGDETAQNLAENEKTSCESGVSGVSGFRPREVQADDDGVNCATQADDELGFCPDLDEAPF